MDEAARIAEAIYYANRLYLSPSDSKKAARAAIKELNMAKRRSTPMPDRQPDTSRLCSAAHLRWYISTHPRWGGLTDAQLGEKLGLSAGYVGMVMSGARPPTKAFLKAIKWEAVTLYQMKNPRRTTSV